MARGLLVAALASAHLLPAHALRNAQRLEVAQSARVLPEVSFTADFVACDEPQPCGRDGLPSHYLLDILRNVEPAAERVAAAGRTPTLLHIGAADFGNKARFADQDLYTQVSSLLSDSIRQSYKLVLVEPNELMFPMLRQNVQHLPIDYARQVQIVQGMVSDSCNEPFQTMFRFSLQAEKDYGIPWVVFGTWVSFNPRMPLNALKTIVSQAPWYIEDPKAWQRFYNAPNVTDYVEGFKVPCYSPSTLLEKHGILASDLAMVVIDAEQLDSRIIGQMMQMPNFKPAYLQWEGNPEEDDDSIKKGAKNVQGHGFKVGTVFSTSGQADADNLVAVPVN